MTHDNIQRGRLLRLPQIIAPLGIIPVSRATWYAWIAEGRAPKPVHVSGTRVAFWRAEDVERMIAEARHVSA